MTGNGTIYSSGERTLAVATRSIIFMLIFCFAGCAAGSCLSYGHSCWGAHGKRSGGNLDGNNLRSIIIRALSNSEPPAIDGKLTRLLAMKQPPSADERYRVRWRGAASSEDFRQLPPTRQTTETSAYNYREYLNKIDDYELVDERPSRLPKSLRLLKVMTKHENTWK